MKQLKRYYDPIIIILALFSVVLVVLDVINVLEIERQPFVTIDFLILAIFALDYFGRLFLAEKKGIYVKKNILDLIAIIPFNSVFALFRVARIFRVARLARLSRASRVSRATRLTRLFGVVGKALKHAKRFLRTNGFIYMVYACGIVILIGATVYSIAEEVNYVDSLWWAFVTSTTVGYGDISPATVAGRIAAVFLMLTGIGLFGVLTSTVTTFFMELPDDSTEKHSEIKQLENKIDTLMEKIDQLEGKERVEDEV